MSDRPLQPIRAESAGSPIARVAAKNELGRNVPWTSAPVSSCSMTVNSMVNKIRMGRDLYQSDLGYRATGWWSKVDSFPQTLSQQGTVLSLE